MSNQHDSNTPTPLRQKLAALLPELQHHIERGAKPHFGLLRNLLGQRRILILPSVKNHHEVLLPGDTDAAPARARATVIVEITLLDAESTEQLATRWIGQAVDAPMVATERAITHAMEDFLQKTFLVFEVAPHVEQEERAPLPAARIRRQPEGASHIAPRVAAPAPVTTTELEAQAEGVAQQEPAPSAQQLDLPSAPTENKQVSLKNDATPAAPQQNQLDLLELSPQRAANEDTPSQPLPPLTEAWKTANALWRALVNEVAHTEVMDAYEDAIERQHDADSWRRVTPEQIRSICQQLRKRSALPPDIRKMSDREEYILSQLPFIPEGSSLNRLEEELRRLSDAVVERDTTQRFMALYLSKMNASSLSEVPGKAAIAMARKLRKLKDEERAEYITQALSAAQRDEHAA